MTHHPHDEIEAFALGSLDDATQREVLDHADVCPTCAVLLADAMAGVGALAALEEPRPMTRSMVQPLVPGVRGIRQTSLPAWLAGAAVAASFVLLFWNLQLRDQMPVVPIGALVHSHFTHHTLTGAGGDAKVLQALDGSWVYVVADHLTPGARYTLWQTRAGATSKVGDFVADRRGLASSYFDEPPGTIDSLAVTAADKRPSDDPGALRWP